MDIVFAFDENYSDPACVAILSMLKTVSEPKALTLHLLSPEITKVAWHNLRTIASKNGAKLILYGTLPDLQMNHLPVNGRMSAAVYRLLTIPAVVDCERVVYLDADVLVRADIRGLYETDLLDYPLGAVSYPEMGNVEQRIEKLKMRSDSYFNSGVMLMDLTQWRKQGLAEEAVAFGSTHPSLLETWDQCALNAVIDGRYLELNEKWNYALSYSRSHRLANSANIVHFTGRDKPWHLTGSASYAEEYLQLASELPIPRNRRKVRLRDIRRLPKYLARRFWQEFS